MEVSHGGEVARRGPQSGRRIIEFRARGKADAKSPGDEDLAVGQERRGMVFSRFGEAARSLPRTRRLRCRFRSDRSSYRFTQPSQSQEDAG